MLLFMIAIITFLPTTLGEKQRNKTAIIISEVCNITHEY